MIPGNINKAQRRSGGKTFWEIYDYLPRETRAIAVDLNGDIYGTSLRDARIGFRIAR